tara:strand:+ start:350 stop:793 length:444 start_codon:yes stop_codon:yes gene_type:complete
MLLSACSINNLQYKNKLNDLSISIETPSDRDNVLLKENLRRLINSNQNSQIKYKLKASITFKNAETLSVRGLQVLKSSKAIINYSIIDNVNGNMIKSGSFVSFPALNSTSESLYSNEVAKIQIKDRLNLLSAKRVYTVLRVALGKLN